MSVKLQAWCVFNPTEVFTPDFSNACVVWAYTRQGAALFGEVYFQQESGGQVHPSRLVVKGLGSYSNPYTEPSLPGIYLGDAVSFVSRLFELQEYDEAVCGECGFAACGLREFRVCEGCEICLSCLMKKSIQDIDKGDYCESCRRVYIQHMRAREFSLHLDSASAVVRQWPAWKQCVLGASKD